MIALHHFRSWACCCASFISNGPWRSKRRWQKPASATPARRMAMCSCSLPLEGIQVSELAETRRAAAQANDGADSGGGLERLGYVERRPDPRDRRGRLVFLTERGRRSAGCGGRWPDRRAALGGAYQPKGNRCAAPSVAIIARPDQLRKRRRALGNIADTEALARWECLLRARSPQLMERLVEGLATSPVQAAISRFEGRYRLKVGRRGGSEC